MEAKSEVEEQNDNLFSHNPCNYFQELIRAVLNCLGFTSDPPTSSSNVDDDPLSSAADPPSSAADPPADPPVAAELRVASPRAPPRPPITGGRGAQTNANPN